MKVTIVGSGFAGVKAALELSKDPHMDIHVITDKPDFQYYPSLYSSATGHSHLESWVPLGEIFADRSNIQVTIDSIVGIDAKKKEAIGLSETRYHYDTLLIAVGTVTTYFGIPGLDQYSYGIKSADQIRQLKERIYRDLAEHKQLDKNYVVIGGGPTGVELASALGTYLLRLARYHGIRSRHVNIRLIEAAPRLLPRSHPKISQRVQRRLENLGVQIEVGCVVEKETAQSVIAGGRPIASHTVIWTSGVMNNPLFSAHPEVFKLAKNGRVVVDEHLMAADHIYVLGDNAATPYCGLAQTALHDAKFVAKNLIRKRKRQPLQTYAAVLPASSIPVGPGWAAFEWKFIRLYGWPGAVLRRVADFIGYTDILPIGQAIRPWHAGTIYERDYFAPSVSQSPERHRKKSS
ncbi:MAG TPA: FAD-dependent oxidoreductase [Patescibacteria group bacterium]|nr:FAD-dependent oxidoreductase [Patescibacteria group bacterium]